MSRTSGDDSPLIEAEVFPRSIPLTAHEEGILDEAVERGGFADRTDFLAVALVGVIIREIRVLEGRNSNQRRAAQ